MCPAKLPLCIQLLDVAEVSALVASWKAPAVESAPVSVPASPDWPTHGSPGREVSTVEGTGRGVGGSV